MMKEESISNRQLLFLVVLTQIGTRVLNLPYAEAKYADTNGILAVLIGGCASQLGIILIWWLGKRYPTQHIFQYLPALVGRPIGGALTLLYAVYYAFSALTVTLIYTEMLSRWVLIRTPSWILPLLIFIVCAYAAMSTLRVLASISISTLWIIIVSFVLIISIGLHHGDIRNLLPIWHGVGSGSSFAYGVFQAYMACLGYDLLLYAFPYVKSQSHRKLLGAMSWANGLTTFLYLLITFICERNFTPAQMSKIPEPIIFILKQYEFKIIQSLDHLFIIFWIIIIAATVFIYLFLAAKAMSHLGAAEKGNHVKWVWICTGVCFTAGCFVREKETVESLSGTPYEIFSLICIVCIPLLLLIVSGISNSRRRSL